MNLNQLIDIATPLPWYVTDVHVQSATINEDNYVCEAEGNTSVQAAANAALITHAVNLLSEAVELLEFCTDCDRDEDGEEGEWRDGQFYPGVPEHVQRVRDLLQRLKNPKCFNV